MAIGSATLRRRIKARVLHATRESNKRAANGSRSWIPTIFGRRTSSNGNLRPWNDLARGAAGVTRTHDYSTIRKRGLMFQMAEKSYRHEGTMGVNKDVLRLLVRPGGAGMVVCLSSFLVRADVARSTGGFDPKLLYSQDSEFMFRLAMLTGFCYVNRPLVWFDRSPAEIRHVGVSAEWNKMEFFLQDSQLRLEGLLRLNGALPRPVLKIVREQLRDIHSGWTNWYLQAGQYEKARRAASEAARTRPDIQRRL